MAFKQVRKIVRYGKSSIGIVLPREWLDYYGLGRGDELLILGNQMLVIAPKHLEENARELVEQTRTGIEKRTNRLAKTKSLSKEKPGNAKPDA